MFANYIYYIYISYWFIYMDLSFYWSFKWVNFIKKEIQFCVEKKKNYIFWTKSRLSIVFRGRYKYIQIPIYLDTDVIKKNSRNIHVGIKGRNTCLLRHTKNGIYCDFKILYDIKTQKLWTVKLTNAEHQLTWTNKLNVDYKKSFIRNIYLKILQYLNVIECVNVSLT